MNQEDLLILYAKDRLIRMYGNTLLAWKLSTWLAAVIGIITHIDEDHIPTIKTMYLGGSQ